MSLKNKWLVKSDYKILGPYSYEQVEDLILKKQISLIDEIRDMNLRWSYVREVPDFKVLVEVVREEIDQKSELTQTLQTTSQRTISNHNETGEHQKTETGVSSAFTGVDFGQDNLFKPKTNNATEADHSELEILRSNQVKNSKTKFNDNLVQKKQVSSSNWFIKGFFSIVLLIIIVFGAWYGINNYGQNKNDKIAFQKIRKLNLYGQDEKNIELIRNLSVSAQDKILSDVIPLWPKLEAAGVLNTNRILDFMSTGKIIGNERKSEYQLFKFNKALNMGDIQNAKDALIKAIDLDPTSIEAKENDAILYYIQKNFSDSKKAFKALYTQSNQGRFLYGYALSVINSKALNVELETAYQLIENHTSSRVDFNKELLFLQIYIAKHSLSLGSDILSQHFNSFVEFPHQFIKKFKRSQLVSNEIYNWTTLAMLKDELLKILDAKNAVLLNLQFFLETNNLDQFYELFSKSKSIFSENEIYNLEVAYNFLKKQPDLALQIPVSDKVTGLYLSTQVYLLIINTDKKSQSEVQLRYVNMLMKQKALFSIWAQLMMLKYPEDKIQIKSLVNSDKNYSNLFSPYLEAMALNND